MRLLIKQNIKDILFFDIETAHQEYDFDENSKLFDAWEYDQMKNVDDVTELIQLYKDRAPLYAEYGKIICITVGAVSNNKIVLKTFTGDDEKDLLERFSESVTKFANNKTWLCGHNILDFDIPFVMKRCLANGVRLHSLFDTAHLKPWETSVLDTALLWKGTAWKKQSFIAMLTALGLPSPKDDISGKDVGRVYYEEGVDRIVKYCEKDVVGVINAYRKLCYEEPLEVSTDTTKDNEPEVEGVITYLVNGGKYTAEVKKKLKEVLDSMRSDEKDIALDILNAIPTRAKGKQTNITKKHIKELC